MSEGSMHFLHLMARALDIGVMGTALAELDDGIDRRHDQS